jgi:serine/threonine protein kinase
MFSIRFKDGTLLSTFPTPDINDLTLVNPDGTPLTFTEKPDRPLNVPILGSGAFGVVVRAEDSIGLHRVVKFIEPSKFEHPAPASTAAERTTGTQIVSDLTKEIQTTNARLFKHVVPVVACNTVPDINRKAIPYTVSPYVDGPVLDVHLSMLLAQAHTSARTANLNSLHDLFLDLVDDLIGALVEMEEGRVSHIDLKPGNIIVQKAGLHHPNVRDQAFVIDFAGAVSLRAQEAGTRVLLMNTPWFFPPAARTES